MITDYLVQKENSSVQQRFPSVQDPWDRKAREGSFLLEFNDRLDARTNIYLLNETIIADLLTEWDSQDSIPEQGYWLTLARIHELTLLCTENYANNCEFTLVGDLMIHPRLVLVHFPGAGLSQLKKRHMPLSLQFGAAGETKSGVRSRLKMESQVEIIREALLSDLSKRLQNSHRFDQSYLDLVEQRKRRISDLLVYLASGGIGDNQALRSWMKAASPADRELLKSRFCRLDFTWFVKMGRRIREGLNGGCAFEEFFSSPLDGKAPLKDLK